MMIGDKPLLTAETTVSSTFSMDDVIKTFVDLNSHEQAYFINKVGEAMINWGYDFMEIQALDIGKYLNGKGKKLLETILYEE